MGEAVERAMNPDDASREAAEKSNDTTHSVMRRAGKAGTALMVRQALVYGANIAGSVVLARLLPPGEFGFYGIVLFAIAFLGIFGGTGFAANLIITREEPALEDMRVVFTAQQVLVLCLFSLLWILAPVMASMYHMPVSGQWFFRMIGAALVLTSFMVMPQIRLERELAFDRLAFVEVSQAITFNVSAIFFAWKGWGALSFSTALMLRAAVGAVLAHYCMPWKIGFRWHLPTLSRHIHFGVALQAGQFVSMLKDSISPLFVGMFLGAAEVGYVTWATSLTAYAVWILMPLQRLYLPLFSRLSHDRQQLRRVVSFALWMANTIAAPLTLVTIVLARPITQLIFGEKWLVALPLYYLFCFGNLFVPCSTPMLGVLNALGQSKKTLAVSLMWMLTTWGLGVPGILWKGLIGFGIAMIGVQLSNLVLFWMVYKAISLSAFPSFLPSWPLAAAMGLVLYAVQRVLPIRNIAELTAYVAAGLLLYAGTLWFGFRGQVKQVMRLVKESA